MKKPVTLKDLATELGLAVMTVSYAMKGSSMVSAETIKRVRALAKKRGYKPNKIAQAMRALRKKY